MERDFTDDSSGALGLSHSVTGEPIDGRGRRIVILPPAQSGYRPDWVGKSPEEIAQLLEAEERARIEREANDVARIMREAPGGRTDTHHGSGGRRRIRRKRGSPPSYGPYGPTGEMPDLRPMVVSGRVSHSAFAGLFETGAPSVGEMLEVLGRALHRVSWVTVAVMLTSCASAPRDGML